MEFRLLGALEVRDGDRLLPLGGSKQRALLAVLLLNANGVVSRDRLIDELWGDHPPETAVTSVQVYVSRLRKVLPPGTLVTQAPGYLLRADPEQIDVVRFERLVRERRHRDALALWRGPPLAEFADEPFAQAEIARLEEIRLAAVEERIEADLADGRHAELVGELERLISLHPLRERLRGQLLVALYRSGRQAEALDAYQSARRVLVDELGLEPSAALQRLEKAILVQDASLDAPAMPAPADEPDTKPEPGERKLVTVLFADLGATATDEDPERARSFLVSVHDLAASEIELAGGTVERGVADAVLATFGAPAAQEDHAERALHASLALRTALAERFGDALSPRLAVETGTVMVGGADGPVVAGRPVTVASALVRVARPGEIRVGGRAAAAVEGAFELEESGGSSLLVAVRTAARARGVRGLGRAFVGRENELETLRATLMRVGDERAPHLVTIVGEAGVGKTSLVRELRAAGDDAHWHIGRCVAYGRAITYRPLADVLRERFGLRENDPQDAIRAKLEGREILGLALGLDVAGDLHPREARDRLHDAWIALLSESAAMHPLVMVVEDVHWAEEALLALLERIARDAVGPVLVLATARPELLDRAPGFGGRGRTTRVWLEPLSDADSRRMLDELAEGLPARIRETLVERAEGNPFFVEELLQTLIDRGTLRREDRSWKLADVADGFVVPDTINAVLAARVDLLPPVDKRALQAAAVIGRLFWERPVRELIGEPDLDLLGLEDRDLVRRRAETSLAGEREYGFKHALLREVAYSSLPTARRARLHASFAEWVERELGERDEHASLLARHGAAAVRPEDDDIAWSDAPERYVELRIKAVTWLRRAAELAAGRYELTDALGLVADALELETGAEARVGLLRLAAEVHRMQFEMEDFRNALERALAEGPRRQTAAEIYGELAQSGAEPYLWKEAPGDEEVERWTRHALELAGRGSRARAKGLLARALAGPNGRREAADEALLLAERLGEPELLESVCFAQSRLAARARDYESLEKWVDRLLEALQSASDPDRRTNGLFVVTLDYLKLGRLADARRVLEEHGRAADPLSPHHRVHAVSLFLLDDIVRGRWDDATSRRAEAERRAVANRETPCQFNWRSLAMCALAAAELGKEREAAVLEQRARELAGAGGPAGHEPAFIRLALLRRDVDLLEQLLKAAPLDGSVFDVDTPAARLDALLALGDRKRVEAEAARWLELPGYTRPFALRSVGVVRGDRELVDRAAAEFETMGLGFRAEETRALAVG